MSIERGTLLLQSGRFEMAEREFRAALVDEPSNAQAHAMIGLCLLQKEDYAGATEAAQQAIQLRPDWAFGYRALASILSERQRLPEAAEAIEQAIQLDPHQPEHLRILANIRLQQRNWPAALAAADRGLIIDPEHAGCLNIRGIALVQLGRRNEAAATMAGALHHDPHNAVTHANQGWALLHSGDYKPAMEHFREALRINPNLDWAKQGIVEAMKARNPIYRVMLRYFLFMSRLSRRAQWGIVVGAWIGFQVVRDAYIANPKLFPVLVPLMIAYGVFVLLSWLAGPLFNMMLRLNPYGQYALSRDQRVASNWLVGCFSGAISLVIAYFLTGNDSALIAAIMFAIMSLPLTTVFKIPAGWPRHIMAAYCAALAIVGAMTVAAFMVTSLHDMQATLFGVFLGGVVLSSWFGNALIMSRVRR